MVKVYTTPPHDFNYTLQVCCCFLHHGDKYLLLQNSCDKLWGTPGGKLEAGESPRDAIVRELKEEIGHSFNPLRIAVLYVRREDHDFVLYIFHVDLQEPIEITLSEEHSAFRWVYRNEFITMPLLPGALQILEHFEKTYRKFLQTKPFIYAHLVPIRNGRVLLALRKNTGYCDNQYGLISGHVEEGESVRTGLIREVEEEAELKLQENQLQLGHIQHHRSERTSVSFFFACRDWEGEFINKEPYKCGGFEYFPFDALPANTIPQIRTVLHYINKGIHYSDEGWR